MAKIPRIQQGDRPSGVPGGALPGVGSGAAPAFDALGNLADVGYKIASDIEKTEIERLRRVAEQKQAIVDEVSAGRFAGDYEEFLVGQLESGKKTFWDAPDQLPDYILSSGRAMLDRQITQAPNDRIGLELAQRGNARLMAVVREAHNFNQSRQTQKAKGDLDIIVNRAVAGAESVTSLPALVSYIKTKEAELTSVFQNVLGPTEAATRMPEVKTDMTQAWLNVYGARDPLGGLAALAAKNGPLIDYFNPAQREAGRRAMVASHEGLTKTRELDAIRAGFNGNQQLATAYSAGDPDFAGIAYSQRRSLVEQKKAVVARIRVDTGLLQDLGVKIEGYSPADLPALIDERIAFIDALGEAKRRQTPFDAPGDPTSVAALLVKQKKALDAKNGKQMSAIVTFQKDFAVELAAKRISEAAAATMFKSMSLALDAAAAKATDVGGAWVPDFINTWKIWTAPDKAGNAELNRQFEGAYRKVSPVHQMNTRLAFITNLNVAQEEGRTIGTKDARDMALRALALELGEPVPGVR